MNRRTWLQYSTRFALLAIVVAALPFAWLRRRLNRAMTQAEAVRRLQSIGGIICYDHEWDDERDCFSNAPDPGIPFLRDLLGDHFFLRVSGIVFSQFDGKAQALSALSDLPTITDVAIVDSPQINDDIFPILAELQCLESVSLAGTAVTDRGMKHLSSLPHVTEVNLNETAITSNGFECLTSAPNLQSISIARTQVSVDALDLIRRRFPNCRVDHDREVEQETQRLLAELRRAKGE